MLSTPSKKIVKRKEMQLWRYNSVTNAMWVCKNDALAGNRTRVSRVAGENSTTEPPMPTLHIKNSKEKRRIKATIQLQRVPKTAILPDNSMTYVKRLDNKVKKQNFGYSLRPQKKL